MGIVAWPHGALAGLGMANGPIMGHAFRATCTWYMYTVVVRLMNIENLSSKSTGGAVYTQCTSAARSGIIEQSDCQPPTRSRLRAGARRSPQ